MGIEAWASALGIQVPVLPKGNTRDVPRPETSWHRPQTSAPYEGYKSPANPWGQQALPKPEPSWWYPRTSVPYTTQPPPNPYPWGPQAAPKPNPSRQYYQASAPYTTQPTPNPYATQSPYASVQPRPTWQSPPVTQRR